jgi:hypothetical protein
MMAKSGKEEIDKKLLSLNLELIAINKMIERAEGMNDFDRRLRNSDYKSLSRLRTDKRTIQSKINYLQRERDKFRASSKSDSGDKQTKHDRAVEELDKRRQANPKLSKEEILRRIAEDWEESYDAIKRAYYYKPKK